MSISFIRMYTLFSFRFFSLLVEWSSTKATKGRVYVKTLNVIRGWLSTAVVPSEFVCGFWSLALWWSVAPSEWLYELLPLYNLLRPMVPMMKVVRAAMR